MVDVLNAHVDALVQDVAANLLVHNDAKSVGSHVVHGTYLWKEE